MSSTLSLKVDSPEARQLQHLVQIELARRRWSEGEDDEVMSEYILVMVGNRKTQAQIATELKELLGEAEQANGQGSGEVDSFVAWMWGEGERVLGEMTDKEQKHDRRGRAEDENRDQSRRRSASPSSRKDRSIFHSGRRWESDEQEWRPRELFATEDDTRRAMASDSLPREQDPQTDRAAQRVGKATNNNLFRQSMDQAFRSRAVGRTAPSAEQSIFARTGVPDPRANAFVPRGQIHDPNLPSHNAGPSSDSLLFRIDPMLPFNAQSPANVSVGGEGGNPVTDFPAQPQETSLCRWGLKCTSPTCVYSHASSSAVPRARQTGEEPLVLRKEPCHYQKDCSKPDCEFSHVSPAVKFVIAKADRAASLAFGGSTDQTNDVIGSRDAAFRLDSALESEAKTDVSSIPCRYGAACYRNDCHFQHPAERSTGHISERLKQFSSNENDGEMEVIIPVA